jgi:hypothetical protein
MLTVYIDETGDPNGKPTSGASREYGLGVLVIDADNWRLAFDGLITMRRSLKRSFGIPTTAEIKASNLVRNEGWFKGATLSASQKQYIYRSHLKTIDVIGASAFAIWVDKRTLETSNRLWATRDLVWQMLFQRLQRTYAGQPILLVHDEGEEATIRKCARKARRFLTAGSITGQGNFRNDLALLVDDPVSRRSHESLMIQCADLIAYSAAKAMIPGGSRANRVCPPSMWNALGSACVEQVNALARRYDSSLPAGIAAQK